MARGWPVVARFVDPDDTVGGVIISKPEIQPDPYDATRKMAVIMLADGDITYELRVRNQMVDAVHRAVTDADAGATNLQVGGYLGVTFIGYRGRTKRNHAVYEPPEIDDDPGGDHDYDGNPAEVFAGALDADQHYTDNEVFVGAPRMMTVPLRPPTPSTEQ